MTTDARRSPLAKATANQRELEPPGDDRSPLRAALAGARPFIPWRIPRLDLAVEVTLVPSNEAERIEAEVWKVMGALGLDLNITTEPRFEVARAKRFCAAGILTPGTRAPIGSLADWDQLDEELIGACWSKLLAVRSAYDPLARALTEEEIADVDEVLKKKDPILLRLFGTPTLASYLLASEERRSNSQTPTSPPGE